MLGRRRGGEPDLFDNIAADAGRPAQQRLDDLDARRVSQSLRELGDSFMVPLGRSRSLPTQFDSGHWSDYSLIDELRITIRRAHGKPVYTEHPATLGGPTFHRHLCRCSGDPQLVALFAGVPLTNEHWTPLAEGELVVISGGHLVARQLADNALVFEPPL